MSDLNSKLGKSLEEIIQSKKHEQHFNRKRKYIFI